VNLTNTLINTNDTIRRLSLGATARLFLLLRDAEAGFTVSTEVKRGWNFEPGEKASFTLEVPELPGITARNLRLVAAFGLWEKNIATERGYTASDLAVLKIDSRTAPTGETRMWVFDVSHLKDEAVSLED
jgi:hypothetical protein